MSTARFTNITLPPSVNAIWSRSLSGQVRLSDAYRTWKRDAGWELKLQRQPPIKGHYTLAIRVQTGSTKADLGNLEKATSDLLQSLGIIENDSLSRRITLEWAEDVKLLEITVKAAA